MMGGMRLQARDVFVVVSYDFEYVTEEGKEVWMKEGEILLLLNKTNNDWWQVIRRGDRRPFYAPARYVIELKEQRMIQTGGGMSDWDSAFSSDQAVHYRPDNGEPLPVRLDQMAPQVGAPHFSTFLGGGGGPPPPPPSSKRSSYSPSHTTTSSSDFLFGAPRFQERYRSNSMDSILMTEMTNRVAASQVLAAPRPDILHHNKRQFGGQVIQPPPNINLEKRPTFDNINKRTSWSSEMGPHHQIGVPRQTPIQIGPPGYPYLPATLPHHQPSTLHKKPVPLPSRSKIPVPTLGMIKQEVRTFKRSKTDLSQNMLSSYKAGRALQAGIPGPKEKLLIQHQLIKQPHMVQKSAQLRSRPSNRANRPAVISEETNHVRISKEAPARISKEDSISSKEGSTVTSDKQFLAKFRTNKNITPSVNRNISPVKVNKPNHSSVNKISSPVKPNNTINPPTVTKNTTAEVNKNNLSSLSRNSATTSSINKNNSNKNNTPTANTNNNRTEHIIKPMIKEKPKSAGQLLDNKFSGSRSSIRNNNQPQTSGSNKNNNLGNRVRSESDIVRNPQEETLKDAAAQTVEIVDDPGEVTDHDEELKISLKVEGDRLGVLAEESTIKSVDNKPKPPESNKRTSLEKRKSSLEKRRSLEEKRRTAEDLRKNIEENRKSFEELMRKSQESHKLSNGKLEIDSRIIENSQKHEEKTTRNSLESLSRRSESKENLVPINNMEHQVTSLKKKPPVIKKVTNEKFLDMDTSDLPEPPPTPPELRASSNPIEIKTLVISTEPMSVSSCSVKGDDKSACSTSFDSLDGSLDSAVSVGGDWSTGDWLEPSREIVKSPGSGSTCSRSPPSPQPGLSPTRHVCTDWDEFVDSPSGRKFYCNSRTGEKSWKPPRRSTGGGKNDASTPTSPGVTSVPTSPDPFSGEQSFELSLALDKTSVDGFSENDRTFERIGDCSVGEKIQGDQSLEKQRKFSDGTTSEEKRASVEKVITDVVVTRENSDGISHSRVPSGYEIRHEDDGGETYFVNMFTGVAWYSATDKEGRIYYYEENGNESCWSLPNVARTIQDHSVNPSPVPEKINSKEIPEHKPQDNIKETEEPGMTSKTDSLRHKFYHSNSSIMIGDVHNVVVKQGLLNKTRITENGKKYRKNWAVVNTVLTDTFLLLFKDTKTLQDTVLTGKSCKPDQCVELKGATIEWCNSDKSKRSNVFQLGTVLELRLLMQDDDFTLANDWFCRIENVILSLSQRDFVDGDADDSLRKVSRTKSLKLKLISGQPDEIAKADAPDSPGEGVQTVPIVKDKFRIREKLRKFFLRRPAVEDLMKRGIMKNEPVFGSTLQLLAKADSSDIPLFVKKIIAIIESKVEYLSTDGVYRQSGNLSVVQRLRLQIDQGNLAVLDTVDDVHVLTGALKLFFRELKEPLIPWDQVDKLLNAINQPGKKAKIRGLKEVLIKLPTPNQSTVVTLLKHLEKVTSYKEVNRMAVANLAIVFGPTLMWPPAHLTAGTNMALNMMQQNMIVEALISNLSHIT